jgi:hypothetical protein
LAVPVGALALTLALAACGHGGAKTAGSAAGGSQNEAQAQLAWARCMREHGIDVPDPQITSDGIDQQGPGRMDPGDPRLTAAERACAQYGHLPPAKPGG